MSWTEPILGGGNALIREEMKSPNFLTGVSGWDLDKDGDAEFNSLIARGSVTAKGANNSSVVIQNSTVGDPSVKLQPGDFSPSPHTQLDPAQIIATSTTVGPLGTFYGALDLSSPTDSGGGSFSSVTLRGGNGVSRIDIVANSTVVQGDLIDNATGMLFMKGQKSNLNISFAAASNFIQGVVFPVAFPVGVVPNVLANINAAAGTTTKWGVRAYAVTNVGFNIWCTSGDGTSAAWAGVNVTWTAIV